MLDEVTLILPPSPIKHQGQTFDLRVIFEGKLPTSLLFNASTQWTGYHGPYGT